MLIFQGNVKKDPLAAYKKYLRTMGVHIRNYDKFFENCRSAKSKKQKLLELMEENGLEGK